MPITITIETGLVVTGANSFVSLADFQAYHGSRGNALTAYTDEQQKAALVKASDYLNGLSWKGFATSRANPMCWPRFGGTLEGWNEINPPASSWVGVIDASGYIVGIAEVPPEVVNAQCKAAYRILGGEDLQPSLKRGGQVKMKKVDVIQTEYFPGASPVSRYLDIESELKGLLKSSFSTEVVRA